MESSVTIGVDVSYINEKIGDLIMRGGCNSGEDCSIDDYDDLLKKLGEHFSPSRERMGEVETWRRIVNVHEILDAQIKRDGLNVNEPLKDAMFVLRDYLTRFFKNVKSAEENGKSPSEAVRSALVAQEEY